MIRTVVVKVGGSLLDWPELPDRLADYLAGRSSDRLVLVGGGGRAVDFVRELDRLQALGDERAHALALRALDLTAHALAALVPRLVVVEELGALEPTWSAGRTPILAPRVFLENDDRCSSDPLPHSWSVTSDSIAARLAVHLVADELTLFKSTLAPAGIGLDEAARLGLVDSVFPRAAGALPRVTYRNLRDPTGPTVVLAPR